MLKGKRFLLVLVFIIFSIVILVATLNSTAALVITKQPEGATGKLGDTVTLTVAVSGGKNPLKYQWQYADAGGSTFYNSKAEGNTSNILIPPIEEKAYDYRCVITDANGESIISNTARVQKK